MAGKEEESKIFWVGIGASAGGLEALRDLVRHLSTGIGAIYVVLQHMSPQHKSLLTELIDRETELSVLDVTDGAVPEKDCIYISPPNHDVIVRGGRLRLLAPSTELAAPKPSVDRFFRSLAETVGDRAIGIVLSGTGSDGAYGVRAVRAAGGVTIAQSADSAKYDGMPLSAIDTGCVDLVLSPEEIGLNFDRIARLPRDLEGISDEPTADALAELFKLLRDRTGVDFREYKSSTVRRRIERRMVALEIESLSTYTEYVAAQHDEVDVLFRDMMISVTSFFRDPEEFELLRTAIEERVIKRKSEGLRIWVPGCATGEEAYSVAVLVAEALGGLKALDSVHMQVFATDIDSTALTVARRGIYSDAIAATMPEDLLETYFNKTHDGYQVSQAIRDRIVFTPHNLCQDPPFSNIDLVSCRNLLIYFAASLQAKVFIRLHYALKASGVLFLGKSESISGSETLFKPLGKVGQLFLRRSYSESKMMPSQARGTMRRMAFERRPRPPASGARGEEPEQMFHSLVRSIGPNGLLVTPDMHIQRVYGNVNRFLSLTEGHVAGATIGMLRDDLRHELRTLIPLALRHGTSRIGVERWFNKESAERFQVVVHPIGADEQFDDLALVVLREWTDQPESKPNLPIDDEVAIARIRELEHEVISMRESLQQTAEELETANEELQSLNEELQSANEELQSTNEELETANEELQSTNEELITVNEELQINSHEMTIINQELDSILSNIAAPVMVVDARLHIVQCSQSARAMFKIESGVAKPHLSQLSLPSDFPPISSFMAEVIHTGEPAERDIAGEGFRGSIVAAPYFNPKGELIGATAIVHETSDPRVRDYETLFNALPLMIWQKDRSGRLRHLNGAAASFFGAERQSAIGKEIGTFLGESDSLVADLESVALDTGEACLDVVSTVTTRGEGSVQIRRHLLPYAHDSGEKGLFVVASRETGPQPVESRAPASPAADLAVDWRLSLADREVHLAPNVAARLQLSDNVAEGTDSDMRLRLAKFLAAIHADDRGAINHGIDNAADQAVPFALNARLQGSDDDEPKVLISGRAERASSGEITAVVGRVETRATDRPKQSEKPAV